LVYSTEIVELGLNQSV